MTPERKLIFKPPVTDLTGEERMWRGYAEPFAESMIA